MPAAAVPAAAHGGTASEATLTLHGTVHDSGQAVDTTRYLEFRDQDTQASVTIVGPDESALLAFLDRARRRGLAVTLVAVAEPASTSR